MMLNAHPAGPRVITDMDLREHFRTSLEHAIANQQVDAEEETVFYLVNMLAYFVRAERLFEKTADGWVRPALAMLYAQAIQAASPNARFRSLKQLGDVALLVAGLFADSLNRKPVDVDYYIAMGATAYGCLTEANPPRTRIPALRIAFTELSSRFQIFVDVLAEVSEQCRLSPGSDLMRLYEIWARTGSPRAARKLRALGVEPVAGYAYGRRRN